VVYNASPGIEVGNVDMQIDVPISRNPFSFSNVKAYKMLKRLCKDEHFDIIHCHTPVGGVLGRMVGHIYKNTKVIYTAHGFHFYKGAPFIDWFLWYPIEKHFAKKTDCIVTINQEDYEFSQKKFKTQTRYISGVGVNINRFVPVSSIEQKQVLRDSYGFNSDDFILIYCAQFIKRKNHRFVFNLIPELRKRIPKLRIIFVGNGNLENKYKKLSVSKGYDSFVNFMGYRKDVEKIYQSADLLISTSLQEGFGINIVEGMASGLPVVCSDIRGHNEIINGINGYRIPLSNPDEFINKIVLLNIDKSLYKTISQNNIRDAKKFDIEHSVQQMGKIYKEFM